MQQEFHLLFSSRLPDVMQTIDVDKVFSYAKSEDNKRLMTTFLSNGAYHMIRQWLLEEIPKTPEEMGDLIYLVATQGWERPLAETQEA